MNNMRIIGTGSALPGGKFHNNDIEKLVETSDEWIQERTGIETRNISLGESVAELGAKACENALKDASVSSDEIDMIITATCSPEMALPCVSCQIQKIIGADNAVCFDLNAACSGFLFALNTAYTYLAMGIYKKILVAGAEVLSKITDWSDRNTCILFGDGAGAVVVSSDNPEGKYLFCQHSLGAKGDVLSCRIRDIANPLFKEEENNKYIQMNGPEVFRFAVGTVPKCIAEVLEKAGEDASNVDYFILHQANRRIVSGIAKKIGEDMSKFPTNVAKVGNTSSASIPILLDECHKNGIFERGMKIVLSGFGAGLTYGATYLEW